MIGVKKRAVVAVLLLVFSQGMFLQNAPSGRAFYGARWSRLALYRAEHHTPFKIKSKSILINVIRMLFLCCGLVSVIAGRFCFPYSLASFGLSGPFTRCRHSIPCRPQVRVRTPACMRIEDRRQQGGFTSFEDLKKGK